jgi:energy-coupling factor transporter ATP-binding protein EcfA2
VRLAIHALPGIETGFTLERLGPGLNLVVGPNASGKSSLCRAVRALLGRQPGDVVGAVHLQAELEDRAGALRVTRTGAEVTWERDGQRLEEAPPLPEARFLRCFTIDVDSLLPRDETTDLEIGRRIALELSGGYDLDAIRAPNVIKRGYAASARRALRETEAQLDRQRRAHQRIVREEAGLEALRSTLADAEAAAGEASLATRALALIEARGAVASAERALGEFPPGMDRLVGDEAERLDGLAARCRSLESEREAARVRGREARAELAAAGLAAVDGAALQALEREHIALGELERACVRDERAARAAEAVLGAVEHALGARPGEDPPRVDRETVARVERMLERKRATDAERLAVEALLDEIGEPAAGSEPVFDPERLRAAREGLLAWLAAPPPLRRRVPGLILVGGGLVLLVGAAALGLALGQVLLAVLVAGAGIVVAAGLVFTGALDVSGRDRRTDARLRFERSGLEAPGAWDEAGVARRLDEVDAALREAQSASAVRDRRGALEGRRARAEAQCEALRSEIATLAEAVRFDPLGLDASLARWFALVSRWDDARAERDRALATLDDGRERLAQSRACIVRFLADAGELAPDERAGANELAVSVSRVRERLARRDRARAALEEAERDAARLGERLAEAVAERAALLERAGLVAEGDLVARIARLDAWRAAARELEQRRVLERERHEALGDPGSLGALVAGGDVSQLQAAHAAALARAAGRDGHAEEIGRIRADIEAARAGRTLEEARAAWQAARDELEERLDAVLAAEAGCSIVDRVERDHVARARPAVLAHAEALFARFTRHRYSLGFDAGGARFTARDNEADVERALHELSSGTRMQLLLAVRIAFASEVEPGEPLPLFLDEALTTADPERHRAVAACVGAMVTDEGRQIFYLTAQPQDARFWVAHAGTAVQIHDLGKIRGQGRLALAEQAAVEPVPAVPAPGDLAPERYAVVIGAAADDPWQPAESVHLFHLLRDDLPLLHRLLAAGVERVGALRALLDSEAASLHVDADETARLRWRLRALDAHRNAWRVGRGRPLGAGMLAQCPRVGRAFLEPITSCAESCGGDARMLLEALDGGAVKGFGRVRREAFEDWLVEEGHLDARTPLDALERALRVEAAVRDAMESGPASLAEVRALVRSLDAAVA